MKSSCQTDELTLRRRFWLFNEYRMHIEKIRWAPLLPREPQERLLFVAIATPHLLCRLNRALFRPVRTRRGDSSQEPSSQWHIVSDVASDRYSQRVTPTASRYMQLPLQLHYGCQPKLIRPSIFNVLTCECGKCGSRDEAFFRAFAVVASPKHT
ncbi:unnamed protein product [Caenorhabditis auriculariae]|uniref:Uncharacterized protein n=1 Tax=Caenorhabditis auriculariae TaxID=2777116 RepID=A0A8S1GR21_9PELO|nr:unnamed protein product [Caenorhabditis auriculariae]